VPCSHNTATYGHTPPLPLPAGLNPRTAERRPSRTAGPPLQEHGTAARGVQGALRAACGKPWTPHPTAPSGAATGRLRKMATWVCAAAGRRQRLGQDYPLICGQECRYPSERTGRWGPELRCFFKSRRAHCAAVAAIASTPPFHSEKTSTPARLDRTCVQRSAKPEPTWAMISCVVDFPL
jgi:hypothetical protein